MRIIRVLIVAIALGILFGCGGGGGNNTPSPFGGSWTGPWTDAGNAQNGTLTITIATNGNLTGSIHNTTLNLDGSAGGSVDNSGNLSATYTYPTQVYTSAGTVSIGNNGHMTGVLRTYQGGTQFGTATIDLTKQ